MDLKGLWSDWRWARRSSFLCIWNNMMVSPIFHTSLVHSMVVAQLGVLHVCCGIGESSWVGWIVSKYLYVGYSSLTGGSPKAIVSVVPTGGSQRETTCPAGPKGKCRIIRHQQNFVSWCRFGQYYPSGIQFNHASPRRRFVCADFGATWVINFDAKDMLG